MDGKKKGKKERQGINEIEKKKGIKKWKKKARNKETNEDKKKTIEKEKKDRFQGGGRERR